MKSIEQIAEDFSYYIPGDMKRFKKRSLLRDMILSAYNCIPITTAGV